MTACVSYTHVDILGDIKNLKLRFLSGRGALTEKGRHLLVAGKTLQYTSRPDFLSVSEIPVTYTNVVEFHVIIIVF